MNIHYFRINIGKEWQHIFPKQQILETATEYQAYHNLGEGKYVMVEREKYLNILNQENYSSENLFTYDFYNSRREKIFVSKGRWRLEQIEEYEQDGEKFTIYLHISDPSNIQRKVKCYLYQSNWKAYGSRFIYVVCSSINYLLFLANECQLWSDNEAKKIARNPLMLYKNHDSLFGKFLLQQESEINTKYK